MMARARRKSRRRGPDAQRTFQRAFERATLKRNERRFYELLALERDINRRKAKRRRRMRQIAKLPRPNKRRLPDNAVRPIAAELVKSGVKEHKLQFWVRAELKKKGLQLTSPQSLRDQLTRLGFRKRKRKKKPSSR
jgi:hypothetical protein